MKRTIKDWLIILVLLLDEVAALVLVLLVLSFLGITIPLLVTIVIALLLGAFGFIIQRAVIPTLHKKKITGSEGMIGLNATVIKPLTPVGVVIVCGELWKTKSVDEDIEAGEEVEIVGINGLILIVRLQGQ